MDVRVKRVRARPSKDDGRRVLVDRLWPRGVSQEKAELDEWLPDVAPSDELREWFGHDPQRFDEFRRRYVDELRERRGMLTDLRRVARSGTLTLLFAAKDEERNNAVVLADVLERGLR
jgi:uncharacterized protein YeaO (DUF488 family)